MELTIVQDLSRSRTFSASATYFGAIRFWQNNYDDIPNKNTIDCIRFKYIQETLITDLIAAQELFCHKSH